MSRAWLKLYVKLLDDYDAMCLDDLTWRRMVEIFLVAADYDRDGLLPDMKQLGVRMRHDDESISNAIAELVGIGIIQEEAGTYRICNWDIYQPPTTSTERTRKYRQRQRGEADPLVTEWEGSVGPITAFVRDDLEAMVEEVQKFIDGSEAVEGPTDAREWVIEAIREGRRSSRGRMNAKYVKAIVDRWMREGFQAAFSDDEISEEQYRTAEA